ncbi:MAG: DUF1854 domain-containing protein [Abditibacteriales bacterium]|nr:DUF1854 domain-containing protein [Abditibacteriales bacterium]MDW8364629.1 DUF1854 domain-containing protein [Abditibacteriales bacterium]
MSDTPDFSREIRYFDPKQIVIKRNQFNELVVELENGETLENVTPVRAFPLTAPTKFIAITNQDGEDLGLIEDVEKLDRASRTILEEELAKRYFIPRIHRVLSLKNRFGVLSWEVETDRGVRTFEIRERDDIRRLPGTNRVLLRDVDGNRYEIPDTTQLDVASQMLLETVV